MTSLSRRSFLKGATALGAAAALGAGASTTWFAPGAQAHAAATEEWKPATCPACHNPICGTQVKVVDGVAVEIKGDPKSPTNQGRLCPRGLSVLGGLYHPYRVKKPLKRTNPEKGLDVDPGWVEITWDEAMEITTQKLKECMEKDPRGLFTQTGFGNEDSFKRLIFEGPFGTPNGLTTSGPLCADHFGPMATKGTKVDKCDMERCDYLLLMGRSIGDEWGLAHQNTKEYVDAVARGMKVVCVNPRKTNSAQTGEWVPIAPGTDVAMCWAIVNVMLHEIGRCDEHFLKVRTNSSYLVEDAYETLKGTKVCFQDYVRDPATGKPLVWDQAANAAVPFDTSVGDTYALFGEYEVQGKRVKTCLQLIKDYVVDMTPEWAEEVTTVPATTTRRIAQELVDYARIGSTIEIDGETFPFRPAMALAPGRGANSNPLNVELFKAIEVVNELLGNIDVPGGSLGLEHGDLHVMKTDADGLLVPPASDNFKNQVLGQEKLSFPPQSYKLECFYPHELHVMQLVWRAAVDPESYYLDYKPEVYMVLGGGNPLRSNSNPEPVVEALKQIPFTFTISLWMDELTQFADIVLPEHHALERYALWNATWISNKGTSDYSRRLRIIEARKPVVEPVFDTRQQEDLLIQYAHALGILPKMTGIANKGFQGKFLPDKPGGIAEEFALSPKEPYTYADVVERKLKTQFGGDGWDAVSECAVVGYELPDVKSSYIWHWHPENAYRIPVYFSYNARSARMLREMLAENNIEFPHADIDEVLRQYSAAPLFFEFEGMHPTEEFPFKVLQFKTHFQVNDSSGLSYNHWLHDVEEHFDPNLKKVLLAPARAAELGLAEGDEVVIESMYGGKTSGVLHLSEMIHPSTLAISGKWGAKGAGLVDFAHEGPHYNTLLNDDERDIGFMMGNLNNSVAVKVYKA
ncbi:MAG TPA: molybdopterin-dependent oxidoreductase [Candidatus Gordonibacter avicola]|nr:molybdopterin-dependent oxidoreductase [Candidatus Gordonibacter avicola]